MMDLTEKKLALASGTSGGVPCEKIICAERRSHALEINTTDSTIERDLIIRMSSDAWEARAGAYLTFTRENIKPSPEFLTKLSNYLSKDIGHPETRLRISVGAVLKKLTLLNSYYALKRFAPLLIEVIVKYLNYSEQERILAYKDVLAFELKKNDDAHLRPIILHETMGWGPLETAVNTLQGLIEASNGRLISDSDLMGKIRKYIIEVAAHHVNRYIREANLNICTAIAESVRYSRNSELLLFLSSIVKGGLVDEWTEVVYAASRAAQKILSSSIEDGCRYMLMKEIAPGVCLHRYSSIESVRLLSQATWLEAVGKNGGLFVTQNIEAFVTFYCMQSSSLNESIREASCHCIREVVTKIDARVVQVHLKKLFETVKATMRDHSSAVREAACLAGGKLCSQFPLHCKPEVDEELIELYLDCLTDDSGSLRKNAAMVLGIAMSLCHDDEDLLNRMTSEIGRMLEKVFDEPICDVSHQMRDGCVSWSSHESKISRFSDQPMHSCCCALSAPNKSKVKTPWKTTDGALHLLKEIMILFPSIAEALLPRVAKIASLRSCEVFDELQENLWNQLNYIASVIGNQAIQDNCELFAPVLLRAVVRGTENNRCQSAAKMCLSTITTRLAEINNSKFFVDGSNNFDADNGSDRSHEVKVTLDGLA